MSCIILCKRILMPFFKCRLLCINDKFDRYRCLTHFAKSFNANEDKMNRTKIHIYKNYCRKASNSNSDPKSNDNDIEEQNNNVLDDIEFKNILKDFSKDFGINNDTEKILEDIKKSLDEGNVSDQTPSSKTIENPNSSYENKESYSIVKEKYKEFSDSDSKVIQSYEDIQSGACEEDEITFHIDQSNFQRPEVKAIRGISGVYDVGELVAVLQQEKLTDIAVISIPKEYHYADFLVLATASSLRHSKAVIEYVIKLYKMKKHKTDPFIVAEGEKLSNWKAIDMGNIVLHIFLAETRAFYDIESLWLFDTDFDSGGTLKPDPIFDAIQEQLAFFNNLKESSSKECTNEST